MQKILIFLFVNGKCYGTQLHRAFKTALTPLQKALDRLEQGGLITSYYEGKTRLYQFNPGYPLLSELEQLLKKAYTLLPAQEKKDYYIHREDFLKPATKQDNKHQILLNFWDRLLTVRKLTFQAKTKSKEKEKGWNGKGQGEVMATKEESNILIFHEKGNWLNKESVEVSFSNVFRWTLDRQTCLLSLEHLRRGINHPVFLFNLGPSARHTLSSIDSHLCGGDTYFGQIHLDQHYLRLNWRVIGPKKNEEMDYYYS